MQSSALWPVLWIAVLLLSMSCAEGSDGQAGDPNAALAVEDAARSEPSGEPVERKEAPLPAFAGWTLGDERLSTSDLIGKRLLLFLFNPEVATAPAVARAVAAIAPEQAKHNFEILGVAQGSDVEKSKAFLAEHGLAIRSFNDPSGQLGARIGARIPVGLVLVDAEGYLIQGTAPPEGVDDVTQVVETMLRDWFRLPDAGALGATASERPLAPDFRTERLTGGETFELSSLRGRPVVLIFFLHTCPHCHSALRFLRDALAEFPESNRPALVGVSVMNRTLVVQERLKEEELDFFPVLLDPDEAIQRNYGAVSSVPVIFLIDAQGRIAARVNGWRDARDPPLMRMRLARAAGQPVPMLLHKTGYSGDDFCGACHESQARTFELTRHAGAFGTLVKHGADRKAECVGCHVVGFGHPGGYDMARPEPALEGVGCETCHGRGGPHLSPEFAQKSDYRDVCVGCHNPTHSLGFDYATFLPLVSHAANASLTSLPAEERQRILEDRGAPRRELLESQADYVGSQACQSCHEAEYATWSEQPHASALRTLESKGHAADVECLRCHTTGFEKPGGFAASATRGQSSLAAVGCESCHGPGSEHVKPEAGKIGTILSLGDKCDSCVILRICGSCHDEANDPGFEFEVLDKIEKQRHGTIEAGTGKPLEAQMQLPSSAWLGALERAMRGAEPGAG